MPALLVSIGALSISMAALIFTIGSFWWLHARQGALESFEPHSFAAAVTKDVLYLRFPLVFFNTGAKPIVVQNLQLKFPVEPTSIMPLPWRTKRSKLQPARDDDPALPAVFSIPGRTAQQMFVEFGGPWPGIVPEARDYQVRIEAKVAHHAGWQHMLTFTLRAAHITSPGKYITYSNAPHDIAEGDREKATLALQKLLRELTGQHDRDSGPGCS